MQYTLRKISKPVDDALRRRAREEGKSLNEVATEALARGIGYTGGPLRQRDLRDVAGSWLDDAVFDEAIAAQERVDEAMWR